MLFRKNFNWAVGYKEWLREFKDLVDETRECIGRPDVIIATDFEGGRVSHFPPPVNDFPFAMKFCSLSGDVAHAQAEILKAHGFNFTFAPVVDIHSNPANPVIGPRAFGCSAREVIEYALPYATAMLAEGVVPCPKHFPGHGDTKTDSHIQLPTLEHPLEFLRTRELVPFKAMIDAGFPAIMTSHVVFKAIQDGLPATMSSVILRDILRGELGFKGAILSDCVGGMRAIYENFSIATLTEKFFTAGGDILIMWERPYLNHQEYFDTLDSLAQSNSTVAQALEASEKRVSELLGSLRRYDVVGLQQEDFDRYQALITKVNTKSAPLFFQEAPYVETAPPAEEPLVRVGVVLPEDEIAQEFITFPSDGEIVGVDGECIQVSAGSKIEINATLSGLDLFAWRPERQRLLTIPNKVILRTREPLTFEPARGFLVERVVAGRIFHWRKEIPQYLSGKLEVYSQRGKLLIVNELPFEDYLSGVATAEMSPDCPVDTLKAQVMVARSYTLAYMHGKHRGEPYSVCNDDDCQRYQGTTHVYPHIHKAIQETRGEVIVSQNLVVRAHYSKCCGGFSDWPEDTWEVSVPGMSGDVFDGSGSEIAAMDLSDEAQYRAFLDLPADAMKAVYCAVDNVPPSELKKYLGSVDEQGEYLRWTCEVSAERLLKNLHERLAVPDAVEVCEIRPVPSQKTGRIRTRSGRVTAIDIDYKDQTGTLKTIHVPREYNIRRALHESFLFSSAFVAEHKRDGNGKLSGVAFRGSGWGHGAGYCQIGALGMGLKGIHYKEIIRHYFPGCEIKKCY
jgi:beta-glucosidase-like glycosyl hydrolase/peptidoglycan hydrolase-like amidase